MNIQTILYLYAWPGILINRHVQYAPNNQYDTRSLVIYSGTRLMAIYNEALPIVTWSEAFGSVRPGTGWGRRAAGCIPRVRAQFSHACKNRHTWPGRGAKVRRPHLPVTWNTLWFSFLIFFILPFIFLSIYHRPSVFVCGYLCLS